MGKKGANIFYMKRLDNHFRLVEKTEIVQKVKKSFLKMISKEKMSPKTSKTKKQITIGTKCVYG